MGRWRLLARAVSRRFDVGQRRDTDRCKRHEAEQRAGGDLEPPVRLQNEHHGPDRAGTRRERCADHAPDHHVLEFGGIASGHHRNPMPERAAEVRADNKRDSGSEHSEDN